MLKNHNFAAFLLTIFLALLLIGCPGKEPVPEPAANGEPGDDPGRYMFDVPIAFSDIGTLDTPRMIADESLRDVHLVYLLHDGTSQRIMYTRLEDGEFRPPTLLSQREGQKMGGGFISQVSSNAFVAYWINVAATGGQLYFKKSDDGGRVFNLENRWNERSEARWPWVSTIDGDITAYFFLHNSDEWELVSNRNFSEEREESIDVANGIPFHLQAVTDGSKKVWLAYFERRDNSDGGRIAFLKSDDGGRSFVRRYLFNDMVIQNLMSFFRLERSVNGRTKVIHIIFTEETPDLTTVYYARSTDNGDSFSQPFAVFSSENPLTRTPLLLADKQYVFIATADTEMEGPAMRYVVSEDGGESFTDPGIATRGVGSPGTIAGVMGADGSLMIVWDDLSPADTGKENLYRMDGSLRGR